MHACMHATPTQAEAHVAREGASLAGGRLKRRAQAARPRLPPARSPPEHSSASRAAVACMAVDASGLLALQQLPTGSQWAWAATRPSEAELRACGLPGSEWSSPAQPQARDVPQARNLLLLLHGLGGQLS